MRLRLRAEFPSYTDDEREWVSAGKRERYIPWPGERRERGKMVGERERI